MAKPKAEASKSAKRDPSPNKDPKKETPSSARTFRKSPARTERKRSPGRPAKTPPPSPSGRSSPGRRSPARKSPGRKSPARKEPTARKRSPGRPPKVVEKAPVGRSRKQVIEIDSDSDSAELSRESNVEKPKAAVRGRARRLDSDYSSPKVILQNIQTVKETTPVVVDREISSYIGLVRRSAVQKSQSREVNRIVHLKHNDTPVQKLTEFSDEDDIPILRSSSVREKSERYSSEPRVIEERVIKTEFGGWIGALLLIFIVPLSMIGLNVFCNETQCSFTKLPNLQKYKYFSTYVDPTAIFAYSAFVLLVAILSALRIGGSKVNGLPNKNGKLNYVMNGVFVAIVTCLVLIALEFFNVPVISFILRKYFQLVISSVLIGCWFAIYLYVRSFFARISALNPYAISNSRIYNFWVGRELNPRALGVIDIKFFLLRLMIGVLILNAIFVYKNIEFTTPAEARNIFDSVNFNPTLLVIAALQTIYVLDFLVFEPAFLTSFEVQYEAVGYLTSIFCFTTPFLTTMITKYVFDHGIRLPMWHLVAATVVFVIGYILYRGSNLQKHAFRQNPYSPALSHLESIPTSQGKKLLVSGYWGFVRHPNYLGNMLMLLSFALFALNAPPSLICYGNIVYLIHRAYRDGDRCKQRYGSAWDRYCQRVRYVLIPNVY